MDSNVLTERRSERQEITRAVDRAFEAMARKLDVPEDDITDSLSCRDRTGWSRFRYELAREATRLLRERYSHIRRAYLWEADEADPEDTEAPAEPAVDLIVILDGPGVGIEDLGVGIAREVSSRFAERVLGTPLALRVHPLTTEMLSRGAGMAAVFHGVHCRPLLVWSDQE